MMVVEGRTNMKQSQTILPESLIRLIVVIVVVVAVDHIDLLMHTFFVRYHDNP